MPRSGWAREPWPLSLCVQSLCSATGEATTVRGPRAAKQKPNNKNNKEHNPPITVKTSKSNHYTYAAEIDGLSLVVYSPEKPLSCGAKVWIETDAPVWIHTGEVIT